MDDRIEQLTQAAFAHAPARDANVEISKQREEFSALSGAPAWSYEVALPAVAPVDFLLRETLPRFTYFLHSHGTPNGAGVFVSVFLGETLYFFAAPDLLALLSQWSGMSLEDMKTRWGEGFSAPKLLLLPPSDDEK